MHEHDPVLSHFLFRLSAEGGLVTTAPMRLSALCLEGAP
jgi:hypothetical protein